MTALYISCSKRKKGTLSIWKGFFFLLKEGHRKKCKWESKNNCEINLNWDNGSKM
jgi:hypothetical protein